MMVSECNLVCSDIEVRNGFQFVVVEGVRVQGVGVNQAPCTVFVETLHTGVEISGFVISRTRVCHGNVHAVKVFVQRPSQARMDVIQ
jgi:hypothetical protein